MKKTLPASQSQWTPRRLSLYRETIRVLNDPALLELIRAGRPDSGSTVTIPTTQESTSQRTCYC